MRVVDFLGLRRNVVLLLGALVLAGTGERLWLGFAPKYLETLGGGILVIGFFDALQTLLGAVYAYPGGWLIDRWGQRRSLLLFSAISLLGYLIVKVWQHWLALILGTSSSSHGAPCHCRQPSRWSPRASARASTRWAWASNPWSGGFR